MSIFIAQRASSIKQSPTLAVAAKATAMQKQGLDVINLGVGEPDFDTPDHIKAAAIDAIHKGFTKYTPVDGISELKQAVIDKFARENQLKYALNQVMISTGGKQCIFNLCQALLNPDDEVLILAPYWVSYPDIVALAGGIPVIINSSAKTNYKVLPHQLAQAISNKTKMLIINSPSNPTGVAYTKTELQALGEVLRQHPDIVIATDDMYEHLLFSENFVNILNACPDLYDRTVVLNGVSKAYAMTGWRIGYVAGPSVLIDAMKTIQSQSTSNPCSIAQKAALAALTGPQDSINKMVEVYKRRHDIWLNELSRIPNIEIVPADGTFYLFPDVSEVIKAKGISNDLEFADRLLNEHGVALVPGSAFGNEGCIRLSFALNDAEIVKASQRILQFCL